MGTETVLGGVYASVYIKYIAIHHRVMCKVFHSCGTVSVSQVCTVPLVNTEWLHFSERATDERCGAIAELRFAQTDKMMRNSTSSLKLLNNLALDSMTQF